MQIACLLIGSTTRLRRKQIAGALGVEGRKASEDIIYISEFFEATWDKIVVTHYSSSAPA